ncbi:CDP-diacylglycerol--serine O-phosphatidyltransferase [Luminiphilus syltensis NOR5-1B]|uniref:CDP-diacylglycerol--serine O-phosphatidyltransferase n=1 Tax=Luminiphilus syltensis NOR5-1B TaxID=565045 RepID=B8KQI5_9GAMM|nr:CDP-diacylglycerol--serine O-phosphatidyltransferase [Luminiphilus syltensis]EED35349.1 CDP-diacylglycerol--serine O-phosphatidyltransferase [Luminiphilus syltensis NOR5-1B]
MATTPDNDDLDDDFERAAGQIEAPLASLVGDYEEVDPSDASAPRARGVYLLPNLFTTGALFAGFYGVVASMQGDFYSGAVAIFVAMVFDGLDGRIARMTNTTSAFGAEYDSMADMVSFGVAPGLLVFNWALYDLGKLGWVAAFIYTACAALRLARFNTEIGTNDGSYFSGLASPAAAALAAGSVWVGQNEGLDAASQPLSVIYAVLLILLGFLMIANLRYYSFKKMNLEGRVPFVRILLLLALVGLVALDPPIMLWLLFLAYALSGPAQHFRYRRAERQAREAQDNEQ